MCTHQILGSASPSTPPDRRFCCALDILHSQGPKVHNADQGNNTTISTQADVSLRYAHISFCRFCCATHHLTAGFQRKSVFGISDVIEDEEWLRCLFKVFFFFFFFFFFIFWLVSCCIHDVNLWERYFNKSSSTKSYWSYTMAIRNSKHSPFQSEDI